ncbi:adenosylcobinamide-GDP ribazoletransferase [Halalkalibacter oceani]|uniref:Adenosylcobinamide-GDP ribazoletransferase n=1 Tax=Halalkalibacter oceani TaxID=1653776 RepID=A0A9X2INC8_9BACI|nr:adenosylcobinamide-GDP ribazoletransferase [Halalkalibacter oceani]MCM3713661.1 adenosylcobinamide-GDP ribazoletransferase [Halalkalibacter oceani]
MRHINILFDGIVLAIQFLTILPLKKNVEWDERRASASVAAYPLVGLILGACLALQGYLLLQYSPMSPLIIALYVLSFSLLFSGGLHVDGWADFCDAVFSRRERARKLEIMKDPRLGTFGALGVLFLLGWRFAFIWELVQAGSGPFLFGLFLIPVIMRLLLGWQLLLGQFARQEGMAAALRPAQNRTVMITYIVWSLLTVALIVIIYPPFLILFGGAALFLAIWLKWVRQQIGGITGDTVGAGGEGGETLLWAMLWLLALFGMA